MDRKIMLIGGGVAAVAIVGFIVVKAKNNAASAAQDSSNSQPADTGFFTGLSPISGGISSTDSGIGGGGGITDPANSGSSATGGGFDIASLLSGLFATQASTSSLQIRSGANVSESAILSSIDLGAYGGTAAVDHTSTGTTLSVTKGGDPYDQLLTQAYQNNLGRNPDIGGLAFFKNQLVNGSTSLSSVITSLQSSTEYQSAHPSNTNQPAPVVTRSVDSSTGTVTMSKSQS